MIKLKDLLMEDDAKFEKHANEYLKRVAKGQVARLKREFPGAQYVKPDKFSFTKGKRYWRLVATNVDNGNKHVHSFLDTTTGDVLKAAGWSKPAKHARGNIYKSDYGMGGVGDHGAKYLR
jgi:hypothetical protein